MKWVLLFLSIEWSLYGVANDCNRHLIPSYAPQSISPLESETVNEFKRLIQNGSDDELIAFTERELQLSRVFAAPTGTWEGESLRTHVQNVLARYRALKDPYRIDELSARLGFDADIFFRRLLLFHDVGKPDAMALKMDYLEHVMTAPLLKQALRTLGASEKEIALSETLMANDVWGMFAKGGFGEHDSLAVDVAIQAFSALAKKANVSLKDYFLLQEFYTTVDATAYDFLRTRAFVESDGFWFPTHPKYIELRTRILRGDIRVNVTPRNTAIPHLDRQNVLERIPAIKRDIESAFHLPQSYTEAYFARRIEPYMQHPNWTYVPDPTVMYRGMYITVDELESIIKNGFHTGESKWNHLGEGLSFSSSQTEAISYIFHNGAGKTNGIGVVFAVPMNDNIHQIANAVPATIFKSPVDIPGKDIVGVYIWGEYGLVDIQTIVEQARARTLRPHQHWTDAFGGSGFSR